jgi:hypothetical protein
VPVELYDNDATYSASRTWCSSIQLNRFQSS